MDTGQHALDYTRHSYAYEDDPPDTVVVDVEDWHPPQAEELVMQVFCVSAVVGDPPSSWHRLMPDHQSTACGLTFNAAFSSLRREALSEPLCVTCFTERERAAAQDATTQRNKVINDRPSVREWLDDQENKSQARIASRKRTPTKKDPKP
jgi:hypothetical protein